MWLIGLIVFVLNGFGCLFALNLIINEKKYSYILHTILFLALSVTSIYLYLTEYLIESLITFFILGGATLLSEKSLLPSVIEANNRMLTYGLLVSSVLSSMIFLFL